MSVSTAPGNDAEAPLTPFLPRSARSGLRQRPGRRLRGVVDAESRHTRERHQGQQVDHCTPVPGSTPERTLWSRAVDRSKFTSKFRSECLVRRVENAAKIQHARIVEEQIHVLRYLGRSSPAAPRSVTSSARATTRFRPVRRWRRTPTRRGRLHIPSPRRAPTDDSTNARPMPRLAPVTNAIDPRTCMSSLLCFPRYPRLCREPIGPNRGKKNYTALPSNSSACARTARMVPAARPPRAITRMPSTSASSACACRAVSYRFASSPRDFASSSKDS